MIGKEVLCIKTNPDAVKEGSIYKVLDVVKCRSCGGISFDVGIRNGVGTRCSDPCDTVLNYTNVWYQSSDRFVFMNDIDISQVVSIAIKI